ncbi:MAG: nucleotide exchange factor GrpE [Desulfohalobiaceae bacterium]
MALLSKILNYFRSTNHEQQQQESQETTQLQEIEARLRKLQTRERRQSQQLEQLHQALDSKLNAIQSRLSSDLPLDSIMACAESLALYRLSRQEQDPALEQAWSRFLQMLEAFDIQLILDQGQQFDDTRHRACDTRWDPEAPASSILEVVRPGLILENKIARPAVVVINSADQEQQGFSHPHPQTIATESA